ncbi:hypothetical protein G7Y79_00012g032980 [Physcia stellaris]|nr:hypothetical protein G7Y79_00012g032980 [Physcia stellaris]
MAVAARYLDDDAGTGSPLSSPDAFIEGDDDDSIPDLIPAVQDPDESIGSSNRVATNGTQTLHIRQHRAPDAHQELSTESQNLTTLDVGMHILLGVLLGQSDYPLIIILAILGIVVVEHHVMTCDHVLRERPLASEWESGLLFASRYAPFAIQRRAFAQIRRMLFGGRRETSEVRNLSWAMDIALRDYVERAGGDVCRGMEAQDHAGQNEASEGIVGGTSEIKIEEIDEEDEDEEDYVFVEDTAQC